MMQYFEKTIKPKDSCKLAKHILVCEACRELYLTFDEAMDCVAEVTQAPENFTQSVMERVHAEKPYSGTTAETVRLAPRILAAVNIILFGIGFMFALNPDIIYTLPQPVVENLLSVLTSVGSALNIAAEWVTHVTHSFSGIGVTALLFVIVMGTLLFVLHSGEKAAT